MSLHASFRFGQRNEKVLRDAAFVAGAGREAKSRHVSQDQTQETAKRAVRAASDAHHARAAVEVELRCNRAVDRDQRLPSGCRARVLHSEFGICYRFDHCGRAAACILGDTLAMTPVTAMSHGRFALSGGRRR